MHNRATNAPQHLRALDRANQVRLARAELKREIADGSRTVAEVIVESPWESESMTVTDLLLSQHRWGRTRSRRFLREVSIPETKTVGSLTDRQRRCVAAQLRGEVFVDPFAERFAIAV